MVAREGSSMMLKRTAIVLVAGLFAAPSSAEQLAPDAARRFVVGKLFSFSCFEGTRGAGRIYADGSVVGTVQFRGNGPVRYAALPAGTLRVKSGAVCASVRGMPFEPCFNLDKTTPQSFRGAVSGLGFAYCDFVRTHSRPALARTAARSRAPLAIHSAAVTASAGD
jgi:hypothetical protein